MQAPSFFMVNDLPLFPEVGLVALVPDTWGDTALRSKHQILTRLSRYFRVLWVDPARHWRECWAPGGSRQTRDLNGMALPGGFEVYRNSRWLPATYSPAIASSFFRKMRLRQAFRRLRNKGCKRFILYLWRPEFWHALDDVPVDLSCYHMVDEYTFSDVEVPIQEDERKMLSRSGQVVIHSTELLRKKGHLNPNTCFIPNGVDFSAYSSSHPEPDDLNNIPHPRVGYAGVIKKQLNLPLLLELATVHRNLSFVYVGPVGNALDFGATIDAMKRLPNTYFLGRKRVGELPAYTQNFDVCTLCYVLNDYTKYISPLKLHEYLASGKPVVGTPIPALKEFSSVIDFAKTKQEWSSALTRSLSPDAMRPDRVAERQSIARQHDWNVLVGRLAHVLCQRLGDHYVTGIEAQWAKESSLIERAGQGAENSQQPLPLLR